MEYEPSMRWTAAAVALLLVGVKVLQAVYRGCSGKISAVPGPLLNRFTEWPLRLATIKGQRVHYVHRLHSIYGVAVRLSPTEVSIADTASAKEIHRIGAGYLKAPWYAKFVQESSQNEEQKGLFAVVDPKLHSARRKLFARGFSKAGLEHWEDVIQSKVAMAIEGIKRAGEKDGKADILAWFTFMANDVIATLSFGDSFKALEAGQKTPYMVALETTMMLSGVSAELSWLAPLLKHISPRKMLDEMGARAVEENQAREKQGRGYAGTIFSKMMDNTKDAGGVLSQHQIIEEASNLLVAGSDTTAVTLTYLIYAILSSDDPTLKPRLLDEVATLDDGFSSQQACELPLLGRVIQETLRLYGAAPGALPRVVPPEGAHLGGHELDAGTVVSTQAFTLHRDPKVFAEPLAFRPDRWLQPTQEMQDAFMPFGGGTRICIGLHLARQELALTTTVFLRECGGTSSIAQETTPESMAIENYFLIAPKSHKCFIIL